MTNVTSTSSVDNWSQTQNQSKKHKINFRWTINDFSARQKLNSPKIIESPTFYVDFNDEMKFCMNLYPNGINMENKGYLSIYVKLLSEPSDKSEVLSELKVSILNPKADASVTNEWQTKSAEYISLDQIRGLAKTKDVNVIMDKSYGYLPDDKLILICEVIFNISSSGQFKTAKFLEDFGKLLDNHKFSDVTLMAGEHKFPAHKAILAARSDVFAAMFEHEMEEIKSNKVIITDIDHEVLQDMLSFIYTEVAPKLKETADRLLAAADKYGLTKLKLMSEEALFDELSIETAAATLVLADLHSANQLKRKTINFMNNHAKEIIKTKGWQIMTKTSPHLVVEAFEALFTSQSDIK